MHCISCEMILEKAFKKGGSKREKSLNVDSKDLKEILKKVIIFWVLFAIK